MDKLQILIPSELFAPAESLHFEGAYAIDIMKAGPDLYTFSAPLTWQVDITNTGGAFLVSGTVEGSAKTACARCLEEFEFDLTGEIEAYFLASEDERAFQDEEAEEFEVLPENKIIDLEPLIKAALLLEFPLVPLCDDDCKGLCMTCGANLNEGPCGCMQKAAENGSPFAVLAGYKFE